MPNTPEYTQIANDHAQNPRNGGRPASFNGHACVTGPCGDTMEFWILVDDGSVRQANFVTDGCGSSMACGSMTTELAIGKPFEDAKNISQQDVLEALGGLPEETQHCALLAANTLKAACVDYATRQEGGGSSCGASSSGSCAGCSSSTCEASTRREEESDEEFAERQALAQRLCAIRHKILVLSGKGGVGKSTVAANLAVMLAATGARVGLLDVDVHGPSIPGLLGLRGHRVLGSEAGIQPVEYGSRLSVISVGFLVESDDTPVIWRGPMKFNIIRQFLKDVVWGTLDYLVVDAPPGTGDEPLAVAQLIGQGAGAVVVTTPQNIAIDDVRRCVSFCQAVSLPVIGVVENMSGLMCPSCGTHIELFKTDGGAKLAEEMHMPYLGAIPIDPEVVALADRGALIGEGDKGGPARDAMDKIVSRIVASLSADNVGAEAGV